MGWMTVPPGIDVKRTATTDNHTELLPLLWEAARVGLAVLASRPGVDRSLLRSPRRGGIIPVSATPRATDMPRIDMIHHLLPCTRRIQT